MAIVCFVLVGLGILLILSGAYVSIADWKKKHANEIAVKKDSLEDTLAGLAKLAEALKTYPLGQQLIVWGIVVLIIAGLFGGVSSL